MLLLNPWLLAVFIFFCRIGDVSLGTLRTISIIQGKTVMAVCLGFFEVVIWITAVSQVFSGVHSNPFLLIAYAAGFASGNAVGMLVERKLALGRVVVRIISEKPDSQIIDALNGHALWITTFEGQRQSRPTTLFYAICQRKHLRDMIRRVKQVDPVLFYAVEPLRESNLELAHQPASQTTSWRVVIDKNALAEKRDSLVPAIGVKF
jgi:uncharacterized protein YebE (UPF0316 family)